MVDCSLVLFSIIGLFALHQESFFIILFFTFIHLFFVGGGW